MNSRFRQINRASRQLLRKVSSTLLIAILALQLIPVVPVMAQAQPSTVNNVAFLSDGRAYCSWSGNVQAGVQYYLEILRATNSSGSSETLVAGATRSGNTGTDQNLALTPNPALENGRYYRCKVWAQKSGSWQGFTQSPSWVQYTAPSTPTAPGNMSAPGRSLDGNYIDVTWSKPSGTVTSYEMQIFENTSNSLPSNPKETITSGLSGSSTSYEFRSTYQGRWYWFKMRACNGGLCSSWSSASSSLQVPVQLQPPRDPSINFLTGTSIAQLDWTAPSNGSATGYSWELFENGTKVRNGTTTGSTSAPNYDYVIPSTSYQLKVCTNSNTSYCVSTTRISPQPVPPVPNNVTLDITSGNILDMKWNAVGGYAVTGYDYEVWEDGSKIYSSPTNQPQNATYPGTPGKTYYFKVRARNNSGPSTSWAISNYRYIDLPVPAVPGRPTVNPSGNNIQITWSSVPYASSYLIVPYRGGEAQTAISASSGYNFSGIPGYAYEFTVRAKNDTGTSNESQKSTPVITLAPGVPSNLITSRSDATLSLGWDAVNGTNIRYDVRIYVNGETTPIDTRTNLTINSTTFTGTPGTSYQFDVRATNAGGESAYSAKSNVTEIPVTPPTVSNFLIRSANTAPEVQPGWTNTPEVTFTFSGSDNITSCTFNGATVSTCSPSGSGTATLSGSGPFTTSVTVHNASGDATSNTQPINLDTQAPTATLRASGGDAAMPSSPQVIQQGGIASGITLQCADTGGSGCNSSLIQYRVSAPTGAACSTFGSGWTTGTMVPAISSDTTICGRVYDNAGNVAYTAAHTIYFDTTPPEIVDLTISQNGEQLTSSNDVSYTTDPSDITIAFSVTDDQNGNLGNNNISQCTIRVGSTVIADSPEDCAPTADGTHTIVIPADALEEGANTIVIEIADASGRTTSITETIFLDTTAPTISVAGLTPGDPNYSTTPLSNLTLSCDDGEGSGCIPGSFQYLLEPNLPENCADIPETSWINYDGTALPTVMNIQQLCVRVTDVAGGTGYSSRYDISVDSIDPTLSNVILRDGTTDLEPRDGVYYTRVDDLAAIFTAGDTGTGLNSCVLVQTHGTESVHRDVDCGEETIATGQIIDLAQGENLVTVRVSDRAGRTTSQTLRVFFDNTPPAITGTFSADANEENHTITLTLPTSFDDASGSGVDYLTITVTQNGAPFTELTQEMLAGDNPFITVEPETGRIIIQRDIDGERDFPATISLINLPGADAGTQQSYGFTLTATDLAGNSATATDVANINGITFDTIAPVITNLRSTLNGDGSQTTPYYVGANRLLPLVFTLREENNSNPRRPSTPVNMMITSTNSVNFVYPDGDVICNSLLADNTCTGARSIRVPENFDGSIDIAVADLGGNRSEVRTIYIRQDSDAPTWGPNGAIEAISPNGAETLEPNTPFLSQTFTFHARDLINDDPEPETYANVTYTNAEGEVVTREHVLMTRTPSTNNYTFTLTLDGLPYGTSIIGFAMEDIYGNRQAPADEKSYSTFYDNRGPEINNFRYAFENDDARISFDSITEDSYPVRASIFQSTDGTEWTERTDVTIPAFADATTGGFNTVIPNVPVGSQVRLEFRDSVQQYRSDGSGFETSGTVETHFMMRDILLSISIDRAQERLNVGYITQADVSDLQSYAVSFTGPNGRVATFDSINSFQPAAAVGNIDAPLMGEYVFTAVLNKTDGSTQTTTRTFTLAEDILRPRATFDLPLNANIRLEDNTYYVNSDDPVINFSYAFAAQQGNIYEESYPVVLNATGIDFISPVSLDSITAGNASGLFPVELIEDRVYTVTLSATDNATSRNAVSRQFRIVKDRSNPEVRMTPRVDGEILTLAGNSPETEVLQTRSATVDLEVAVDNELEAVTMEVRLDDTLLTERTALPPMSEEPFTQGYTYQLTNLGDNAVHTITVMVRDTSGHITNQTLRIRRDNQAPVVTGDVRFAGTSSSVNPVPFLPGLSVTDFTTVYYTVQANGEILTDRTPFTGNAVLIPQGAHQNLRVIFSDELGNETTAYNPLPGGATEFYVDTERPTFDLALTPVEERTTQQEATLTVSNVVDGGSSVIVEIVQNGEPAVTATLARAQFESGSGFTLPLVQNSNNTFEVRIRDGANNLSDIQTASLIQDVEGPAISDIVGVLAEDNRTIDWDFRVEDRLGSGLNTVQVTYRDIESGRMTVSNIDLDTQPDFSLSTAVFYSGNSYELIVRATDGLGNMNTVTSAAVTVPTNDLDELDPIQNGPELDPGITDTHIDVTISNSRDINYVATNLPRGTHVILGEVLANGTNTVTGQPMSKLPVGIYVMTIRSHATGDILQIIDPYIIHPYYTDAGGDLDGNGFGGGISDHKLLVIAEAEGIYSTPTLEARLAEIQTIIENNIATRISQFLAN